MEYIKIPRYIAFKSQEAVEALELMVNDFEGRRGKELTDTQADVLIQAATGISWIVKAELWSAHFNKK